MTSSEIVRHLSAQLEQSQVEIRRLLKHSTDIFKETLDKDFSITIPRLGTFQTHVRHKRKSFSPYHKKFMILPPKRNVTFHPSSTLKDQLKDRRMEK